MRIDVRLLPLILLCLISNSVLAIDYTFIGNGDWRNPANWENGLIPPSSLPSGSTIIIKGTTEVSTPCAGTPACSPNDPLNSNRGTIIVTKEGSLTLKNYTQFAHEPGSVMIVDGTLINEAHFQGHQGSTMTINGVFINKKWIGNQALITVNSGGEIRNEAEFYNNYVRAGQMIIKSGGKFSNASKFDLVNSDLEPGATISNTGTLTGTANTNGQIINSGILAPGRAPDAPSGTTVTGIYNLSGTYTAVSTSIHNFEIGGTSSTSFDQLKGGSIALNGTLNVQLINGYQPSLNDEISIITGSISGSFTNINLPAGYLIKYNSGSVVLMREGAVSPVNDHYSGAIQVTSSTTAYCSMTSGSNIGATQSRPGCYGTAEDDIWFKFDATAISHKIEVVTGAAIDPVLELFTLSGNSLTSKGCRFGSNDKLVAEFNNLIIGTTYYYRVYGSSNSNLRTSISTCVANNIEVMPIYKSPTVTLTTPVNGATFTAPTSINFEASVVAGDEPVHRVEFYNGGIKLGEDLTAPYTFTWNNVSAGSYTLRAVVVDNMADSTASVVSVTVAEPPANQLPTVSLVGQYVGSSGGTSPAYVVLNVAAADIDGSIAKVEIYQNGSRIAQTSPPTYDYSFYILDNEGIYTYQAIVTDNGGGIALSNIVSITLPEPMLVNLASPPSGATFTAPATIKLQAAVYGGDASNKVEFYNGTTKLGEDLSAPYEFTWNSVAAGNYTITAKGISGSGNISTSQQVTITVVASPANQLPTITLTSPAGGASFTAPATINLTATAADVDGTVSKVEFYEFNAKLGEDLVAPYQYTWSGVTAGIYMVRAVVTDNRGDTSGTQWKIIDVSSAPNQPPTVSLTAPVAGTTFKAFATINLTASAGDGDGSIAKVEFFDGTTKIGEDLTWPYSFTWNNAPLGPHVLTAKATDNKGLSTISQAVSVIVNYPPTGSLMTSTTGTAFVAPATIDFSATASDVDGSITKVEFYNGSTKLGEDFLAPYTFIWNNVGVGNYSLRSVVFDNMGDSAVSVVSVTVIEGPGNQPPTLSLHPPIVTQGTTNADPFVVIMNATASDVDGSIHRVEFYQSGTLVGVAFTPPYQFASVIIYSGNYMFSAKAYDNMGVVTDSHRFTVLLERHPRITLSSPSSGATFNAPATVNLSATVDKGDGATTKVEFYTGATKLGEDLTAPYEFNWTNVPAGSYTFTAKVSDDRGYSVISNGSSVTVAPPANQPPTVSLTSPQIPTFINAGAALSLAATASDLDGTINRVEFYDGILKLGEDVTAPYELTWNFAIAGIHTLTAKAIDNNGLSAVSQQVQVIANQWPTVTLTSPPNGATFMASDPISLTATASDADGSIVKVEFYSSGTKLGEDLTAPYSIAWNASPGIYQVQAIATDNSGAAVMTEKEGVEIFVSAVYYPPTISLTSPTSGASYTSPASINLTANASDADGTVAKVEFYNGGTKLGEDLTPPYQYSWNAVSAGTYLLSAKAIDNMGSVATSSTVSIAVVTPPPANGDLISKNSLWRYHDKGIDLGTSWRAVDFDDASWSSGNGVFGYDDPVTTVLSYGTNASLKHPSYYFRKIFDITNVSAYSGLVFNIRRDDGAVVYLNGVEVFRTNMPGGAISYWTAASSSLGGGDEMNYFTYRVPTTQLRNGKNVVAVSVHQGSRSSSDMLFDLELKGEVVDVTPIYKSPTISLTAPADGASFTAPATINLAANVVQGDGAIAKVEFYNGTTKLGEDLTAPYTFSWSSVPAGTYLLKAKVTDVMGDTAVSLVASVTVNNYVNQSPTITLTSPLDGATFMTGDPINLTATASDVDGSIVKVEFYVDETKLGEDLTAPYSIVWNPAPGIYRVRAIATDNSGATGATPGKEYAPEIFVSAVYYPPTVSLTAPTSGASFTAPATIYLAASASDQDGTVSKVEFYNGATKIGEDLFAPYEYSWSGVPAGTYTLTAKAIDNSARVGTSSTVSITVTAPPVQGTLPIAKNSMWKYYDKGIDMGTAWKGVDYDDASWSSGSGVFGYGEPITTTISYGTNASLKHPSYYFRKSFDVTNPSAYSGLVFNIRRDDGAVVYLNGVEVFRTNMPSGTIGYNSFASSALGGSDETTYFTYKVPATQLRTGKNVIAVSVHQSDRSSSDLSFDMEVVGEKAANQPPTVSVSGTEGYKYEAPARVLLLVSTASDPDGSIAKVEFYLGGSKVGESTAAPYGTFVEGLAAGTYVLTAKATDNEGASTTSLPATFTVVYTGNSEPPTVSLTSPTNGATFTVPASINLTATAGDVDGTVARLEFYNGSIKIGEDLVAPYQYTWSGVSAGTYVLSAKAVDNSGNVATSSALSVTVNAAPPVNGTFIAKNSTWKYHDKGVDLGTVWKGVDYDDASWSSGSGAFGYDDPVTTTISYGTNSSSKHPAYYFRKSFEVADASQYSHLVFNIRKDDGAVVYLNGVEVFRTNMQGGSIGYNTLASSSLGGADETTYFTFRVPATQLRTGKNVVAVSVHQASRSSSDMSFDLELTTGESTANQAPEVSITAPTTNSTFDASVSVLFAANAIDNDGSIAKVEFFIGKNKLGEDLSAPFEYTWTRVPPGVYKVTAIATDNLGATGISSEINMTVIVRSFSETLIANNSTWKYNDKGIDLGTAWTAADYDDASWSSGQGLFGYDVPVTTTLSYGTNGSQKHPSYYFRKSFEVVDKSAYTVMKFNLRLDDGAVIYLNGVEVSRINMPVGTVGYYTLASTSLGRADETTYFNGGGFTPISLRNGTNVIAISVHQGSRSSSDMLFDLELKGEAAAKPLAAARVSTTSATNKEEPINTVNNTSKLSVRALPNPSTTHFTLVLQSASLEPVNLKVVDATGRIVELRRKLSANGTLTIGDNYRSGMYFLEVLQGGERRTLKLVKGTE